MNLVVAVLIVVATTAVAIAVMLLVRRTAPDGSYFHDGDRAAGVFGVLATGFAVLLGFVVFLAFTSYDAARAGAEDEALTVAQQVETAQFFPAPVVDELTGELVCYAQCRAVMAPRSQEAAPANRNGPFMPQRSRQTVARRCTDGWRSRCRDREPPTERHWV